MRTPILLAVSVFSAASAFADPLLSSWRTQSSSLYARVYQGANAAPEETWPTGVGGMVNGGQEEPAYSDVQRVAYSSDYLYVNATGLASYTMGPWYSNAAKTILFQNWPSDGGLLIRIPRTPSPATTQTTTTLGPIGLAANGVVFYNGWDAFSYSNSAGTDEMMPEGDGIWDRDALLSEGVTFDPGLAHQQNTGQYHYHVNPIALRYQLGDHVTFSSGTYSEAATAPTHSPILGWAFDGYPIYGPYGYSSPMDPTSGVRRMVSGYVKRDGTNGTTNLTATGRTSLPAWAAAAEGRSSAALAADEYGPAVSSSRPLGYYQEDNDYLGDHGYVLGTDFDLNRNNARYCVTPDYPNGTWAYFVTIDASGSPVFPYTVGPQYFGVVTGGQVQSITETVTEYASGGAASPIAVTATATAGGASLSWTSVEGGSYEIQSSPDDATWTTLATNVASAGSTTTFSTSVSSGYFRVTLTALASYDSDGSGTATTIGGNGTGQLVGATGTAYLTNLSTRGYVSSGGSLIAGFIVGGTGGAEVLLRGVGPALATFGVSGTLPDPAITLYQGSTAISSNEGWSQAPNAAAIDAAESQVGAFSLPSGSADAALLVTLAPGAYTLAMDGASGDAGNAMVEVYQVK